MFKPLDRVRLVTDIDETYVKGMTGVVMVGPPETPLSYCLLIDNDPDMEHAFDFLYVYEDEIEYVENLLLIPMGKHLRPLGEL